MSQAIKDGLYAKLTASTGAGTLYAAVSGRIYDTAAPQTADLPFLVYALTNDPVDNYFGGASVQNASIQFVIHGPLGDQNTGGGSSYAQAVGAIELLLYNLLDGASLTVAGHDRGVTLCQSRGIPEVTNDSHTMSTLYSVEATAF